MDTSSLLATIDATELTYEATSLIAWDIGAVSSEEEVASFMYRGGKRPPLASANHPRIDDRRPDRKYWDYVKSEMRIFLCTDDKKYRALWRQIAELQKKSTTAIVGIIATFLGASVGAPATLLAGFVAVCLYAALKVGTEAYCRFTAEDQA